MIVCSYAFDDVTLKASQRMRVSAVELGLKVDIRMLPDQGTWEKNASLRPNFAKQMLDLHKEDVLLVDPSTVFRSTPTLLLSGAMKEDVGLYFTESGKPCSLAIFLRDSRMGRLFLSTWRMIDLNDGAGSWAALCKLTSAPRMVKVCALGPEYGWVEALSRSKYPRVRPVIEHFSKGE